MNKRYFLILIRSVFIAIVGVFGVDYFSHLLFSAPMETPPYFLAKAVLFFIFSITFLSLKRNKTDF